MEEIVSPVADDGADEPEEPTPLYVGEGDVDAVSTVYMPVPEIMSVTYEIR